jgi:CRISPR-associated protein Csb2
MLVATLSYPGGVIRAADVLGGAERDRVEFPPHPSRLLCAMVDTWAANDRLPADQAAIEWLEGLPPPEVHHNVTDPARIGQRQRTPVIHYVPINDRRPTGNDQLVPRSKKPRRFPGLHVGDAQISFVWRDAQPDGHLEALRRLAHNLAAVGTAASMTILEFGTEVPASGPETTVLVPLKRGSVKLRVPFQGYFRVLEDWWQSHRQRRPPESVWQAYGPPPAPERPRLGSVFDELILMRLSPIRGTRGHLVLEDTEVVMRALRGLILSRSPQQPAPEVLTGHGPDSETSRRDHLALFPIGFVGSEHADGHLLGLGAAIAHGLTDEEKRLCRSALARATQRPLIVPGLGDWGLSSAPEDLDVNALRQETWRGPAREWVSVTPVLLSRGSIEENIRKSAVLAGLPPPEAYEASFDPLARGIPHVSDVRCTAHPDATDSNGRPHRLYLRLIWPEPVLGPVLLGRGRYAGMGLHMPVRGSR